MVVVRSFSLCLFCGRRALNAFKNPIVRCRVPSSLNSDDANNNRSGNNTTTDLCDDFFLKRFLFDNVGTAVPTNFLHDGRVWSEFGERVPNRSFFGTNKLMDENTTELYIGIVPRKLYCYKVIVDYGYLLNNLS